MSGSGSSTRTAQQDRPPRTCHEQHALRPRPEQQGGVDPEGSAQAARCRTAEPGRREAHAGPAGLGPYNRQPTWRWDRGFPERARSPRDALPPTGTCVSEWPRPHVHICALPSRTHFIQVTKLPWHRRQRHHWGRLLCLWLGHGAVWPWRNFLARLSLRVWGRGNTTLLARPL